jgi:hypothetical protein
MSAVAEHMLDTGRASHFDGTYIEHYHQLVNRLLKEAIDMSLHANSFNRQESFKNRVWQSITQLLKQRKERPQK